ncbi:hypothetical protein [Streptomyces sp. NPDC060194]|uniref:hypothetical protein n=1 Tax=Streptomyces sp. NPDC060194 TaxID=3347069 RepID=UPI00365C5604
MGYWGYYVVARSERALNELDALAGVREGLTLHERRADGWQVWEHPSRPDVPDVGDMNKLAQETGAPALFGFVMDSACVVVEAAAPETGGWNAALARDAMGDYLAPEGPGVEDLFLSPEDAAERAAAWAEEGTGRETSADVLVPVFRAPAEPSAELLFFHFLERLGI